MGEVENRKAANRWESNQFATDEGRFSSIEPAEML